MTPRSLMALIAFAILLTVALLYLTRDEEPFQDPENLGRPDVSSQVTGPGPAGGPDGPPAAPVPAVAAEGEVPALPGSLVGGTVPTGWNQVEQGELVVTPAQRQLFDQYLAALGEISLAQVLALIEADLEQLEQPA